MDTLSDPADAGDDELDEMVEWLIDIGLWRTRG